MKRRKFLGTSMGFLAGSITSKMFLKGLYAQPAAKRPNIILVNTDDHAQWAVGAYGNKEIHTPNMDKLAREGMLFTRAFTSPVCSPSRAMVMTGGHSYKVGIHDFIAYYNPVFDDLGLPEDTITIARILKDAGYTTGLIGKWHLGYGERYYPTLFGFDYADGYRYIGQGDNPKTMPDIPFIVKGKKWKSFRTDLQRANILTDEAIKFVKRNRRNNFFLFFNFYAPHLPWLPVPDEDMTHYKDKTFEIPDLKMFPEIEINEEKVQQMYREYYANISSIDRNLGRLKATLDNLGLADNTVIVFVGDNGFNIGHHGLLGKGNARILGTNRRRPNMFDTSVLVPLIVRWPGVVDPGSTCKAMVSTLDFFPTFMEIAGVKPKENLKLDGKSLVPLLKGKDHEKWCDEYFAIYDMIHLAEAHMRMIRTNEWKLVLYLDKDGHLLQDEMKHELFNLKEDPDELNNLYSLKSVKDIQKRLEDRLKAWIQSLKQ